MTNIYKNKFLDLMSKNSIDSYNVFTICYSLIELKTQIKDLNSASKEIIDTLNSLLINNCKNPPLLYFDDFLIELVSICYNISELDLEELLLDTYNNIWKANYSSRAYATVPAIAQIAEKLLEIKKEDTVADLCSGACSFLFNVAKQKLSNKTLLAIDNNIGVTDVAKILSDYEHYNINIINNDVFKLEDNIQYSKGFCEPPFNLELDFNDLSVAKYRISNKKSSESLFIMCALNHLLENGKFVFCLPSGFLTSLNHFEIRQYLIANKLLEAVIQLPSKISNYYAISTCLLVISKKNNNEVMLVNAQDEFVQNNLGKRELNSQNISSIYNYYKTESDYSRKVTYNELEDNNFDLSPVRYLNSFRINILNSNTHPTYTTLKSVCNIFRGIQIPSRKLSLISTEENTEFEYLNLSSIENNKILSQLPHLKEITQKQMKYTLKEGDLLIPMAVSLPFKCAISENIHNRKILVASNLYILRLDTSKILPGYLKAIFESTEVITMLKNFSNGTSTHSISIDLLKDFELQLPSLDEQQQFIESYNKIDSSILELKSKIEDLTNKKKSFIFDFFK